MISTEWGEVATTSCTTKERVNSSFIIDNDWKQTTDQQIEYIKSMYAKTADVEKKYETKTEVAKCAKTSYVQSALDSVKVTFSTYM